MQQIFLAILGSSALASLISGVIGLIANRKKQETGVEAGVRILLYDRIKHLGIKHIEKGYITHDEYEDLGRMHAVYHNALNGNGFLDNIMEQVNELPRHRE